MGGYRAVVDSAVTRLAVEADEGGRVLRVDFCDRSVALTPVPAPCEPAARQLAEYFAGSRRAFDLELLPAGTAFQQAVWCELQNIDYGHTISYGELARRIGKPDAVRAVGAANGRNPIPVIIPCHRVIGSNGSLTGFGGGLALKRTLLAHEGCLPTQLSLLAARSRSV